MTRANTLQGAFTREDIPVVSREDFLNNVWRYSDGQHVTMLGPTQRGKTRLALELLGKSISPKRKALLLAGKPPRRDPTMASAATFLNLRVIEEWPPGYNWKDRNNNGWVLRPVQRMNDVKRDKLTVQKGFKEGLTGAYSTTPNKKMIVLIDEAHHVHKTLGLTEEVDAILLRGAPDVGAWNLIQRGAWVSLNCYAAPEHLFLAYDPDEDNQKRYGGIGGVDPKSLQNVLSTLQTREVQPRGNTVSEFLYIKRDGPQLYIVGID